MTSSLNRKSHQTSYDDVSAWRRLLDREDVLVLDTETTGLGDTAEIVEIGVIDTCGTELLHSCVLPAKARIGSEAARVHGLDRKTLKKLGAPGYPEIHEELCGLLNSASMVVVYNAQFDLRVLAHTAQVHGLSLPRFRSHCAMLAYAKHRGEIHPHFQTPRWHTLQKASKYEQISVKQDHRAVSDCLMVLALMRAVDQKIRFAEQRREEAARIHRENLRASEAHKRAVGRKGLRKERKQLKAAMKDMSWGERDEFKRQLKKLWREEWAESAQKPHDISTTNAAAGSPLPPE